MRFGQNLYIELCMALLVFNEEIGFEVLFNFSSLWFGLIQVEFENPKYKLEIWILMSTIQTSTSVLYHFTGRYSFQLNESGNLMGRADALDMRFITF